MCVSVRVCACTTMPVVDGRAFQAEGTADTRKEAGVAATRSVSKGRGDWGPILSRILGTWAWQSGSRPVTWPVLIPASSLRTACCPVPST